MSATGHMIILRDKIDELHNAKMRAAGHGALSVEELVSEVKSDLSSDVKEAESDLIDTALRRLIYDVIKRKAGKWTDDKEADLFGGYRGLPQSLAMGNGTIKSISDLTIAEAKSYLEDHALKVVREQHKGLRHLIEDCLKFVRSNEDTIGVLITRYRDAQPHQKALPI